MTKAPHPSPSPWMRPLVTLLVVALVVELIYTVADRLLCPRLGDELGVTAVRAQLAISLLQLHHGLVFIAADYASIGSLFQQHVQPF
ncbi:MAG: hypothetical protein E8D40_01840 [Nitrospira sp.]|nr:MAG: hypothetical protein E8D40_01840 [Nitrospira sp.]